MGHVLDCSTVNLAAFGEGRSSNPLYPEVDGGNDSGRLGTICQVGLIRDGTAGTRPELELPVSCYTGGACSMRLNLNARKMVMDLFRAILERFFIMRSYSPATGSCANRPPVPVDFCFGEMLSYTYRDQLAQNRRRSAFGSAFYDAVNTLVCGGGYRSSGCVRLVPGMKMYPVTPYLPEVRNAKCFITGFRKSQIDCKNFSWWGNDKSWRDIVTDGNNEEAPWVLDNGMQYDLAKAGANGRPLLTDLLCEYRRARFPDCGFSTYRNCKVNMVNTCPRKLLPDKRLRSFGVGGHSVGQSAHLQMDTIGEFVCKYYPRGYPGARFDLAPLLFARRMLSVMNAQTVRKTACLAIPHIRTTVSMTVRFDIVNDGVDPNDPNVTHKHVVVQVEGPTLSSVVEPRSDFTIKGCLTYVNGVAVEPQYAIFYDSVCRFRTPSWRDWEHHSVLCRRSEYSDASFRLQVVYPQAALDDSVSVFCDDPSVKSIYPARWAVLENDVAFGAVSTFVTGAGNKRAWVSSVASCIMSGGPRDAWCAPNLFNYLANQIIVAGVKRMACDVVPVQGNTFTGIQNLYCGASRPSEVLEAGLNEAVGGRETLNKNIENMRKAFDGVSFTECFVTPYGPCVACDLRPFVPWSVDPPGRRDLFCIDHPAEDTVAVDGFYFDRSAASRYVRMANIVSSLPSLSFSFAKNYNYCRSENGHPEALQPDWRSPGNRVGWTADPYTLQFGGFFGTFLFRNRASVQV